MPGYVMHLAESDMIVRTLRKRQPLSRQWVEHFMTGNLLPDTRLLKEKYLSHFWNPKDAGILAQAPDLELFLGKYHPDMDDPLLLGYLTHLDLDARYVHSFWPQCIAFYNGDGEPETMREKVTEVEILKTGRRVPLSEFFSPACYYGDYGRMNSFFVRKYHIRPPVWEDITDFHMDEVKLADMEKICRDLEWLLAHCAEMGKQEMQVFDMEQFDSFIRVSAAAFVQQYLL